MTTSQNRRQPSANRILSSLRPEQYPLLFAGLEPMTLSRSEVIYVPGDRIPYCIFPERGMISLVVVTNNGSASQIGMVGTEGVVGVSALLGVDKAPYQIETQIAGRAARIEAKILTAEFHRAGPLRTILLRYLHSLISQISQSAACNRFHRLEKRLARWLLISLDRIESDSLDLTHDALSHMLGASRTNVTAAANELKAAGLIKYSRGIIKVLDRQGLEAASCECYRAVTEEQKFRLV